MQNVLDRYKTQLDIFGSDGELQFKPFAILKTIKTNGDEENWISTSHTNLAMFLMLSNEPYCFISEDKEKPKYVIGVGGKTAEFETAEDAICVFWDTITNIAHMEGIVIKPNQAYVNDVAPYIKVRNSEYLRLTYGPEYDILPIKKKRLMDTKSIKRKMETSIKEYELGRRLLDIKMNDISVDNKQWLSLVVQLITEQANESTLDPRL